MLLFLLQVFNCSVVYPTQSRMVYYSRLELHIWQCTRQYLDAIWKLFRMNSKNHTILFQVWTLHYESRTNSIYFAAIIGFDFC